MNEQLKLENIREVLIRQEETIIFALIERAQFAINNIIYKPGGIPLSDFSGSFSDYLLYGTECNHAKVRRYLSPDEHPFFDNLPQPVLLSIDIDSPLMENSINLNDTIRKTYINNFLPYICEGGDDGQYGSSAVCDVNCLQSLSKRIHYGKFVAESKYLSDKEGYRKLIIAKAEDEIMEKLTNKIVEEKLLNRVLIKSRTYGKEPERMDQKYKVKPEFIKNIYEKWIIPLTKKVEVDYLLGRYRVSDVRNKN
ncbi:MAG: chorismate mutase [Verrucomicrobiota bacterium]|nr:chorismate mutase [Verrucomicrobiota bacterium]